MNIVNSNKIKKYHIPFIVLLILTFIIVCRVNIIPGDDEVFRDSFLNNGGIIGWVKKYTTIWSGRVIPHFILIILLNINLIVWRLLNSLMFVGLALGIYLLIIKQSDDNEFKAMVAWIICGLIFFIPLGVLEQGAIWITGSLTYLWPMACVLIAMVPFKRLLTGEHNSNIFILISIVSTIYASYSEQSAAVMIAFETIIIGYCLLKKIKIKRYIYLNYILGIINSIYSLTVVGNKVRSTAETIKFYPDYDMLTIVDKAFLGINVLFNHIFSSGPIFMLLISLLIIIVASDYNKYDFVSKLMIVYPFIYTSLRFIGIGNFYEFNNVNLLYVGGVKQYLSYILAIMAILMILYDFYLIFEEDELIVVSLIFLAAICCGLVMGFSPTVYASGSRIFFATNVLLVLCIASLFRKCLERIKVNKLLFQVFLLISLILSVRLAIYVG